MTITTPRLRTAALGATVAAALLLGACGGGSSDDADGGDTPSSLSGTTATDGSSSSSTTTGSSSGEATIEGAEVFSDPDGNYTIEISPEWEDISGTVVSEVEAWRIGIGTPEFQDNINVLTQEVPGADLQAYLDASAAQLGDLELIDSRTIEGANGNEMGLVEYSGMVPTAPIPVHALATVVVSDGRAILATLTTDETTFAEARTAAEEYLLTLQATN